MTHDLPELRRTRTDRAAKFCGECGSALARTCLPVVRTSNAPTPEVLRRVRTAARGLDPAPTTRAGRAAARGRAPARLRPLRGPRRLHRRVRGARRRGDARAAVPLLRHVPPPHRALRRHGREVHRRRGDGGLGHADRAPRTTPSAPSAPRSTWSPPSPRSATRSALASSAHGQASSPARPPSRSAPRARAWSPGDLVNTASRIQSLAEPGTVLVGEATKRATEAAIVYADAGVARAQGQGRASFRSGGRCASSRATRGTLKSPGLEAPFVGRDRELRLIKDLFHASRRRAPRAPDLGHRHRRHRQVAPRVGVLQVLRRPRRRLTYWHRGRCLSYGEGVTYWALADMVRMRARIAEDEEPASALAKLRRGVEEHLPDAEERRFVEPRLAHLLGLEEAPATSGKTSSPPGGSSSSGWPTTYPVVMVFEDMQWADASLLDFIEYLLEWSRSSPLFVRHARAARSCTSGGPTWGAGQPQLHVASTSSRSRPRRWRSSCAGSCRACRQELRDQILDRAEGHPALRRRDGAHAARPRRARAGGSRLPADRDDRRARGAGDAARAHRGAPRRPAAGGAARPPGRAPCSARRSRSKRSRRVSGLADAELEPLLASLVRKEVLGVQADPRSPEHGQYGFLQDLVRHVAYETLVEGATARRSTSPPPRTSRRRSRDEEESSRCVAAHYLDAYELASRRGRRGGDQGEGRGSARARRRARRVARRERGGAALLRSRPPSSATTSVRQAELVEQAGRMAWRGARSGAPALLDDAHRLLRGRRAEITRGSEYQSSSPRSTTAKVTRRRRSNGSRRALRRARGRGAGRGVADRCRPAWPLPGSRPAATTSLRRRLEIALELAEALEPARGARARR